MIINIMLNSGIGGGVYDVFYWTVNSVPDYYFINMQLLRDPKLFSLLYRESDIKSFVRFPGYAKVGRHAKIQNSFIPISAT
jgi:ADP-glucose pyrophosphorylase